MLGAHYRLTLSCTSSAMTIAVLQTWSWACFASLLRLDLTEDTYQSHRTFRFPAWSSMWLTVSGFPWHQVPTLSTSNDAPTLFRPSQHTIHPAGNPDHTTCSPYVLTKESLTTLCGFLTFLFHTIAFIKSSLLTSFHLYMFGFPSAIATCWRIAGSPRMFCKYRASCDPGTRDHR